MHKKYRHKYKKQYTWDEQLMHFIVKVVGSTALFFLIAISMDVYRLSH